MNPFSFHLLSPNEQLGEFREWIIQQDIQETTKWIDENTLTPNIEKTDSKKDPLCSLTHNTSSDTVAHSKTFSFDNDRPVWMFLAEMQAWFCLEDFLKRTDISYSINLRDNAGRGWGHYCIYEAIPNHIAQEGFLLLNSQWNDADNLGNTPMQAFPHPKLAQYMAARWWNEHIGLPVEKKANYFIQLSEKIPNTGFHQELKRIWLFWGKQ